MAVITAPTTKTIPAYPAAAVATAMQEELLRTVRARYRRRGTPLPKSDEEVIVLSVEIDSLTVVELLSTLDDILPFKVTECVVKAGGYESIAAAVKHIDGRIASKWDRHHKGDKV